MVATPPTIGAVPIGVEPLEKVTGPDTPGGTVSVIVTGAANSGTGRRHNRYGQHWSRLVDRLRERRRDSGVVVRIPAIACGDDMNSGIESRGSEGRCPVAYRSGAESCRTVKESYCASAALRTVAVKVTDWLTLDGFSEEVKRDVGVALLTVCVVVPVAGLLFVSPP